MKVWPSLATRLTRVVLEEGTFLYIPSNSCFTRSPFVPEIDSVVIISSSNLFCRSRKQEGKHTVQNVHGAKALVVMNSNQNNVDTNMKDLHFLHELEYDGLGD